MNNILEKLRKLMNLKESASVLGNTGEANAAAARFARNGIATSKVETGRQRKL
jgi:hypothetical protein